MNRVLFICLNISIALASILPHTVYGEGYYLRFGPTSLGNGGPNPVGIPPGITDMEFAIVTKAGFESNLGLPGLLFGLRSRTSWGGYVSGGGGFVMDANGVGPGAYTAFGWDSGGKNFKFCAEYKQTIGIAEVGLISPYAVRIGIAYIVD